MDFGKRRHSFRGRFFLWWLMSAAISGLGCPLQGSMSERGFRGESGTDLVEAAGAPAKPWFHLPDTLDYSVLIVGMAKGAEGREVVWRADADPVSGKYMELGRGTVDSNGRFILASSEVSGVDTHTFWANRPPLRRPSPARVFIRFFRFMVTFEF